MYYKNKENQLYFSPTSDVIIREGLTEITKAEYDAILAPTAEQVLEQQRAALKQERDKALESITHSFADGSVIQVRPQDVSNIQLAISQGESQKWVMKDNSVRLTTVTELQEALESGIAQGKAIWDNYTAELEVL